MGLEARTSARWNGRSSAGTARLEANRLTFRGDDFRFSVDLAAIESLAAENGVLVVAWPAGPAVLELGAASEKWVNAIRNPRSRIDKLGVRPDSRVAVIGLDDADFRTELRARTAELTEGDPAPETDFVFLGAESVEELARLARLIGRLKRNGAIWVVWPKGRRDVKEADVLAAGRAAGLVDTKVVGFSSTHTALKFVIPRARR